MSATYPEGTSEATSQDTSEAMDRSQPGDSLLPVWVVTKRLIRYRLGLWLGNLASMLLPTNDGFVAMNGARVFRRWGHRVFHLKSVLNRPYSVLGQTVGNCSIIDCIDNVMLPIIVAHQSQ